MKIQFLGTAAAEGVPALFCNCRVCRLSRKKGGRNIRTRSQALIDGKILIDFPPDTYMHFLYHKVDLPSVHTCIVTHNHADHLYTADAEARLPGYAHDITEEPLTFYCDYASYSEMLSAISEYKKKDSGRIAAKRISPFNAFDVEGYKITPLRAAHDSASDPVIYVIQKDGKSFLYGNDTGIFPKETWQWLSQNPIKFDAVSLDCTMAPTADYWAHMGLNNCIEIRNRMIDMGITNNKDTNFILHHFSHNSGYTYDEFVPVAENEGFTVAYDGMITEI